MYGVISWLSKISRVRRNRRWSSGIVNGAVLYSDRHTHHANHQWQVFHSIHTRGFTASLMAVFVHFYANFAMIVIQGELRFWTNEMTMDVSNRRSQSHINQTYFVLCSVLVNPRRTCPLCQHPVDFSIGKVFQKGDLPSMKCRSSDHVSTNETKADRWRYELMRAEWVSGDGLLFFACLPVRRHNLDLEPDKSGDSTRAKFLKPLKKSILFYLLFIL